MRPLNFLSIIAAAIFSAGCAGYQLGPVNGQIAGEKSVEVLPFNNQTLEPRLGDAVTQALRERLQTDGTFHLATREAGDVVVTGVITHYDRKAIAFLNSDVSTVKSYRIGVTAHVTARERDTGKTLLDKNVDGFALVQVGTDLASAERQTSPLLAEDLARNIAELLTEGAW
jgi:hypothetical protein